jgi:LPS-assembly protein
LNPTSPQFNPAITLFNPLAHPRIDSNDLTRFYSELAIDFRPPVIGKTYRKADGTKRFTHVIEPYITYRRIDGLSNYAFVPRFDDTDAVAKTSQLEYSIVNRFFRTQSTDDTNDTPQSQEFLSIKLSQYYFFDPTFGGALVPGQRNQFYPLNTLSSFSSSGFPRRFSPINLQARVRPITKMYADLRLDYDTRTKEFRDVAVTGGFSARRLLIEQTWYYARRQFLDNGTIEPGTFFGSQYRTTFIYGNRDRGWYGGTSLNFNLINRSISGTTSVPRVLRSSTFIGYMGQCCGVELGYQTFDTGLRIENRFSFSFTLAGIGSIGTRNRIGERGLDREGWELDRLSPYNASR